MLEAMAEGADTNLIGKFGVEGNTKDLEVKVEHDPDSKNISATGMGIGVPKAVLIDNLGTVAKSGITILQAGALDETEDLQEGFDAGVQPLETGDQAEDAGRLLEDVWSELSAVELRIKDSLRKLKGKS